MDGSGSEQVEREWVCFGGEALRRERIEAMIGNAA